MAAGGYMLGVARHVLPTLEPALDDYVYTHSPDEEYVYVEDSWFFTGIGPKPADPADLPRTILGQSWVRAYKQNLPAAFDYVQEDTTVGRTLRFPPTTDPTLPSPQPVAVAFDHLTQYAGLFTNEL